MLAEYAPEVAKEWDYEKNYPITPTDITHGTTRSFWWICPVGHSFQARVDHRTIMHSGCPYCAGKLPIRGETDLSTVFPKIAKEWDYEINDLTPEQYTAYSNKSVFWKCPYCGFSYKKRIADRTYKKIGCPNCAKEKGTSFPEQSLLYYLKKVSIAKNRYRLYGKEIDVFLPEYNVGIEYNGAYFHRKRQGFDIQKRDFLRSKGIRLISIIEAEKNYIDNDTIWLKSRNYSVSNQDLNWAITALFEILKLPVGDIDVAKDQIAIKEQYIISLKADNLVFVHPDIAAEWDKDKNGKLKPGNFTCGSNHIAFWKCSVCNTVYESKIYNRTIGQGCPVCAGKQVKIGFNDLCTTNPMLLKEWSEKNGKKSPEQFSAGSMAKIIWQCGKCGFDWQAPIYSRTQGRGCPVCSGKKTIKGYNDLLTLNPGIAREWHPKKNNNLLPSQVSLGSQKKIWWLCSSCGYEWKASPSDRNRGRGCPKCGKTKAGITRHNHFINTNGSLMDRYPDLAKEWYQELNGDFYPENCAPGASEKVWWKCSVCGHVWQARVYSRCKLNGNGCPECGKRNCMKTFQEKRLKERGNLAEKRPDLAAEWDYEENGDLTPYMVTIGSKKKVAWICTKGHKWKATIYSRKKSGCPICNRNKKDSQ